jgi:hypothetical protein
VIGLIELSLAAGLFFHTPFIQPSQAPDGAHSDPSEFTFGFHRRFSSPGAGAYNPSPPAEGWIWGHHLTWSDSTSCPGGDLTIDGTADPGVVTIHYKGKMSQIAPPPNPLQQSLAYDYGFVINPPSSATSTDALIHLTGSVSNFASVTPDAGASIVTAESNFDQSSYGLRRYICVQQNTVFQIKGTASGYESGTKISNQETIDIPPHKLHQVGHAPLSLDLHKILLQVSAPANTSASADVDLTATVTFSVNGKPLPSILTYSDGTPVIDPYKSQAYPRPDILDVKRNIAEATSVSAEKLYTPLQGGTYLWSNFDHGKAEDYQRPGGVDGPFLSQYTDVTFYNYGAVAHALGFSLETTLKGADFYNMVFGSHKQNLKPNALQCITQGWNELTRWTGG